MDEQKVENVLNLALDTAQNQREKSLNLNEGYDQEDRTWELIVKYSGTLEELKAAGITVVYLLNNYAILTVPENAIENVARLPQIEYIEMPKRLFFRTVLETEHPVLLRFKMGLRAFREKVSLLGL